MAEKLAPEKRHSFLHNGFSLSLINLKWFRLISVSATETVFSIFHFDFWDFFFSGEKVFEWDQTLEEVNMYINLPPNVPSKQFYCKIQSKHVELGIKGNPPYLNVSFRIILLIIIICFDWCLFCSESVFVSFANIFELFILVLSTTSLVPSRPTLLSGP